MSRVTAINIIISKKNQLKRYKELCLSSVGIDDTLMWLNDMKKSWKKSYE